MPKGLLYKEDVAGPSIQVGGKAVSQRVRVASIRDSGPLTPHCEPPLGLPVADPLAVGPRESRAAQTFGQVAS